MIDIPTRYNPKETEDKWYKSWEENGLFCAKADPGKEPFCIVIPPPNVTGILHMGHALNNTIQDILIRYQRMRAKVVLWMPGTDHAGIATQNVVEKAIAKEGLKRQDLGREKFIERVWQWKEEYGSTIIRQLKKLGASCDWSRTRFTMDEEYSKAVLEVFVRLWDKGLIYQGDKVINWCPRCQTALSDEEAPHKEIAGALYYIKYPFKESMVNSPRSTRKSKSVDYGPSTADYIVVATTRPETMLGDTGVAVNPKDRRYKKIIGKFLILPLINREIKVVADEMVDAKFGTGAVKVTPAHDPNDYLMGRKHKLDFIKVMHPDGRMNENAGDYRDMDRFEARQVILEDLKEKGLLEKVEPHQHAVGHCYRCHTVIEPYLSRQWFVKMKPLAHPAIEAVKKGKIKFYPARWTKVYLNWMENIQDWCISRQIWWGHRIPVWYCLDCKKEAIAGIHAPKACRVCNSSNLKQDEDVLDTWFSSWLWPFATFYWPFESYPVTRSPSHQLQSTQELMSSRANELKYFYPTSVLVTAPEIIFFWVARMIMSGFEFMGKEPFRDVYIHGTVRDIEGKKMSKSLGNIIDPLDIINEYGTDALRFSLISITAQGQDVYLSKERFEQGRNFANKIWNASRFILMNLDPSRADADLCVFFKQESLSTVNRWILSRFYSLLKKAEQALGSYKFNEAANMIYGFFWHEFCDWYLEMIKLDIKEKQNQVVMYKVLEKSLRLLHPFMPFITEEIWQRLNQVRAQASPKGTRSPGQGASLPEWDQVTSIMIEPWPHIQEQMIDRGTEKKMQALFDIIVSIRNLRQELEIPADELINAVVSTEDKNNRSFFTQMSPQVKALSRLRELGIEDKYSARRHTAAAVIGSTHITLGLEGVVDLEKQSSRIRGRIKRSESEISAKEKNLSNKEFIRKAPSEIVEKEKSRLLELKETLKRLNFIHEGLS